jgi:hypothetical protein
LEGQRDCRRIIMGILTDDMTRLCGEISASRGAREVFLKDLRYVVSEMQTGFRLAHAEMARETKAERVGFVSGLEKTVFDMRKDFATDLAGARQAWFGPPPAERMAKELKEQRRAEAEARKRKEEEERRRKEAEEKRIKEERRHMEAKAREEKQEETEEKEGLLTPLKKRLRGKKKG